MKNTVISAHSLCSHGEVSVLILCCVSSGLPAEPLTLRSEIPQGSSGVRQLVQGWPRAELVPSAGRTLGRLEGVL